MKSEMAISRQLWTVSRRVLPHVGFVRIDAVLDGGGIYTMNRALFVFFFSCLVGLGGGLIARAQAQWPTYSPEFELKISSGHLLVRRKGSSEWKPSTAFKEPIAIGSFDGTHDIFLGTKAVKPPQAEFTPPPDWPKGMKSRFNDARVILDAVVDEQGHLRFGKVDASPNSDFSEEALRTVEKWKFAPAKLNRKPVAVLIVVTMNFAH